MPEDSVQCPNCHTRIPLSAVVTASIEGRLRKELQAEVDRREHEVEKREVALKGREKEIDERVETELKERLERQTPKLRDRIKREIEEERKDDFNELQNLLNAKEERLKLFEKRERELVGREEQVQGREQQLASDAKKLLEKERKTIEDKLRHDFEEQQKEAVDELEHRLRAKEERVKQFEKRERELVNKEEELQGLERRLSLDAKKAIDKERKALEERLRGEIEEQRKEALVELENRLHTREERIKQYEKRERELTGREEEIQDKQRTLALEAKKALDKEREGLVEKVRSEETERWEGQLRERQTELDRLKQALERAQKAGMSGELAGEVAERTLVDRLTDVFDEDEITQAGKGKQGGDVLQAVRGGGAVLWESKDRYENWSNEWIPKLKRDRDDAKATIAVLVTTVGPGSKPLRSPSYEDGVVVSPPWAVVGVASLLRPMVGEIARQRRLYDKQESLQEVVYAWVTSQAFKNGIISVAENLQRLRVEVNRAKINHARWFTKMEVGVDRTAAALGAFWGSAQGHAPLPNLPSLSLNGGIPSLPEPDDEDGKSGPEEGADR